MVKKKSKSKRMGILLQKKIKKKVNNHHERMRKLGRLNPHKKKLKRDPGIPNMNPLKARLLLQIEKDRSEMAQEKAAEKSQRRKLAEKKRREEMVANAATRALVDPVYAAQEKEEMESFELKGIVLKENEASKRHWYFKELKKVVNLADVIIEVLDARDPMGCRCPEVERMVMESLNPDGSHSKRIILVINKIDLVPRDVVSKWIEYFRREFPTLGFKASTQNQKAHLNQARGSIADMSEAQLGQSSCVGGQALLGLLKNYARTCGTSKKNITVGIVGFPNVGKSSLINSLKRTRAVQVGSTPGLTKAVQTVKLDRTISLVDSPGVLFSSGDDSTLVLRNCLRIEQLEDPSGAVTAILERVHHHKIMELYRIPRFNTVEDFLVLIANKFGKLGKGGIPNLVLAARHILEDWNNNKIPFYTMPPRTESVTQSVLVQQWSADFKLSQFESSATSEMAEMETGLQRPPERLYVVLEPGSASSTVANGQMEEESDNEVQSTSTRANRVGVPGAPLNNTQRLRQQRKAMKKQLRRQTRQQQETMQDDGSDEDTAMQSTPQHQLALQQQELAQRLAMQQQQATNLSDDYDFSTDWA